MNTASDKVQRDYLEAQISTVKEILNIAHESKDFVGVFQFTQRLKHLETEAALHQKKSNINIVLNISRLYSKFING